MGNDNNSVGLFRQFAEKRLNNHLAELNTKDRNMEPGSRALQERALEDHRAIYQQELQEKIDSLTISDNPWLVNELNEIKNLYVSKLSMKNLLEVGQFDKGSL